MKFIFACHKKMQGTFFNVAKQRPEGWQARIACHKKTQGTFFNVAKQRPEGWQARIACHKKRVAKPPTIIPKQMNVDYGW
ncbi:hypothetical protein DF211_10210 [Pectobacterium parmentieri]|nr:hypothetical protein DF211_10210 [Pectobacterium parmentieri]